MNFKPWFNGGIGIVAVIQFIGTLLFCGPEEKEKGEKETFKQKLSSNPVWRWRIFANILAGLASCFCCLVNSYMPTHNYANRLNVGTGLLQFLEGTILFYFEVKCENPLLVKVALLPILHAVFQYNAMYDKND